MSVANTVANEGLSNVEMNRIATSVEIKIDEIFEPMTVRITEASKRSMYVKARLASVERSASTRRRIMLTAAKEVSAKEKKAPNKAAMIIRIHCKGSSSISFIIHTFKLI